MMSVEDLAYTLPVIENPNDLIAAWWRHGSDDSLSWYIHERAEALTAAWNPGLHPRGRDGKFIDVGDLVTFLLGSEKHTGTVASVERSYGQIEVDEKQPGHLATRYSVPQTSIISVDEKKATLDPDRDLQRAAYEYQYAMSDNFEEWRDAALSVAGRKSPSSEIEKMASTLINASRSGAPSPELYRGMGFPDSTPQEVLAMITSKGAMPAAMSSFTTDRDQADIFAEAMSGTRVVVVLSAGAPGLPLTGLTDHWDEGEHLVSGDLKVTNTTITQENEIWDGHDNPYQLLIIEVSYT